MGCRELTQDYYREKAKAGIIRLPRKRSYGNSRNHIPDRWNIVAVLDQNNTVSKTNVWGLDISG